MMMETKPLEWRTGDEPFTIPRELDLREVPNMFESRGQMDWEASVGRPLRVLFLLTSMPVGGAETLLANLMRRMNSARFAPELACLKELGPLGQEIAGEFPASQGFLAGKYDLRVLPRLAQHLRGRIDALVTVGAGDKMFWGRIAAHWAKTPVVLSALHSTGWPDGLGKLNRCLTAWTDAFIAVAPDHGRYLVENEKLPAEKVRVIPNGVDTSRFDFDAGAAFGIRHELNVPDQAPLCGIVAALRPEKNHPMFLKMARLVLREVPNAHFVIVGDGPALPDLRQLATDLEIASNVHFLGTRSDIPRVLSAMNVFCLTSHNEANPVSILEALAVQVPVVATNVGSVSATVQPNRTGFLVPPGDERTFADSVIQLINNPTMAREFGKCGRDEVAKHWSLERMVRGYEQLILEIYLRKQSGSPRPVPVDAAGLALAGESR